MGQLVNLIGKKYGRLLVLERIGSKIYSGNFHHATWKCLCECGGQITTTSSSLNSGGTRSCGCLRSESARKQALARRLTPEEAEISRQRYRYLQRKYHLQKKYDLTIEQLEQMKLQQNNQCAICHKSILKKWNVDHIHKERKVRGLLCNPCNQMLGLVHDDVERLLVAANYLRETKKGGLHEIQKLYPKRQDYP